MITTTVLSYGPGHINIRLDLPGSAPEFRQVQSIPAAKRIMYFKLRNYIHKKLVSWIRQRIMALQFRGAELDRISAGISLLRKFEVSEQASFWHLSSLVVRELEALHGIAPGSSSRFYNHYVKEIFPILQFCIEISRRVS